MEDIELIVQRALAQGTMCRDEHDSLVRQIHADGIIDRRERKCLSLLFEAIRSGSLEVLDSDHFHDTSNSRAATEDAARQAIERSDRLHPSASTYSEDSPTALSPEEPLLPETPFGAGELESELNSRQSSGAAVDFEASVVAGSFASLTGATRRDSGEVFVLRNDRLLDIFLNGLVWVKTGSMVAYYGNVKFTREGYAEHGIGKMLKKAITGEGNSLTKATGVGNVYLADKSKKISVIRLAGERIVVSGRNLLAFESAINWNITALKQLAAIWKGGFFNVELSGKGDLALTTMGDPLVLRVSPGEPLMTDMQATVAWSGGLVPRIRTDIALKSFVGRVSGESVQMEFQGDGYVLIQPHEEVPIEERSADK